MEPGSPSRLFSRYQQLIEVARELSSTLDLDSLLARITRAAVEISKAEYALLFLWNETRKSFILEACSPPHVQRLKGAGVPEDEIPRPVLTDRVAWILPTIPVEWQFYRQLQEQCSCQLHSAMFIPFIARDRLLGLLQVFNKIGGQFNEYDQETLQALSSQAAIAIENARLFLQSDLIAELVHELRTPLASISTIAHLLQRADVPETQKSSMVQTLFQETRRLNDLATDYLDLARLEARKAAFHLEPVDLHAVIRECHEIVRHRAAERSVSIRVNLTAEGTPTIEADREKMKQVLLNLLSNAIKYNREGGSITISTTRRWENLVVSVEDTGIGIKKEELPFLFQRYYRAGSTEKSTQGTGLGLYISKRIVENHGGSIEAQSDARTGATFTVTLPARQAQPNESSAAAPPPKLPLQ